MSDDGGLSPREAAILAARTRRLAERRSEAAEPLAEAPDLLVFAAGGERFGLPLRAVGAVIAARPPLPVPDAPPGMLGLIGDGGEVIALFGAAAVLGAGGAVPAGGRHIAILAGRPRVALLVDRVLGVADAVDPAPLPEGSAGDLVTGVARSRAGTLDAAELSFAIVAPDRLRRRLAPSYDRPSP